MNYPKSNFGQTIGKWQYQSYSFFLPQNLYKEKNLTFLPFYHKVIQIIVSGDTTGDTKELSAISAFSFQVLHTILKIAI